MSRDILNLYEQKKKTGRSSLVIVGPEPHNGSLRLYEMFYPVELLRLRAGHKLEYADRLQNPLPSRRVYQMFALQ